MISWYKKKISLADGGKVERIHRTSYRLTLNVNFAVNENCLQCVCMRRCVKFCLILFIVVRLALLSGFSSCCFLSLFFVF